MKGPSSPTNLGGQGLVACLLERFSIGAMGDQTIVQAHSARNEATRLRIVHAVDESNGPSTRSMNLPRVGNVYFHRGGSPDNDCG